MKQDKSSEENHSVDSSSSLNDARVNSSIDSVSDSDSDSEAVLPSSVLVQNMLKIATETLTAHNAKPAQIAETAMSITFSLHELGGPKENSPNSSNASSPEKPETRITLQEKLEIGTNRLKTLLERGKALKRKIHLFTV